MTSAAAAARTRRSSQRRGGRATRAARSSSHRDERHAHELGELRLRVAAEVRELDRAALRLRERLERGARGPALDVPGGLVGRVEVGGRAVGGLEGRGAERGPAAEEVDRAVVGDRQEPAASVPALPPERAGAAPGREEGVLDDVLGSLGVARIRYAGA